uniref:Intraflagellar transport 52 homolog (Chlamydomonas) n=1 Tax=Cyprinus carpio TaxID=7962 RepID=A0A8C1U010_CYPCA
MLFSITEQLTSEKLQAVKLWITAGPREKFTAAELELLKQRLDSGGGLLVMLREGGELKYDSNINFLLEEFGIMVNNDAVIRNVYHKYFHPKEALVSSGVLNREISRAAGLIDEENTGNDLQCLRCDHGTYIRIPLQGHIKCDEANWLLLCFNVCVFNTKAGKLAVLGSCHMFSDQYLDKEENSRIMDVVFQWLTADSTPLNQTDAEDPELSITDYTMLPDTGSLSERLRVCLQEADENPPDFTSLFDMSLLKLHTNALPSVLDELFALFCVQVLQPAFRDLPPPKPDLSDLDETFPSEKVRLAQLSNKCTDDDLEFYVRKSGDILGVTGKLDKDKRDAKHILEHVVFQVVEFKKLSEGKSRFNMY